ncbi:hypothetical protein CgunFtcFv8_016159 [Champsocephalus gunnari]|uniref:Uncharacterized protein n=1 Tax=Champsocephalus gunnari TaxID=52237 RepID=A0AAN8CQP0_CHAGU|nr:hypothetical protein CgunFtcFv8_016159 [Champsocephalus gunnari]
MNKEGKKRASEKEPKINYPPQLSGSSVRSASLCHISLRRSSQRLAGSVWPGPTTGGGRARAKPLGLQAPRWGRIREPLGRGESGSRAAPFKPLGSWADDPDRL